MEKKKHIKLEGYKNSQKFKPKPIVIASGIFPERERFSHAQNLLSYFAKIEELDVKGMGEKNGRYVEFSSSGNFDLAYKSLEKKVKAQGKSIELLNIKTQINEKGESITSANIYIPYGQEKYIKNKIYDYSNTKKDSLKSGKARNNDLISGIENIRLAKIEDFWTDKKSFSEIGNNKEWFEIWLNINELPENQIYKEAFLHILDQFKITYKNSFLQFPENLVMIVLAKKIDLENIIQNVDYLSEIRLVREVATLIVSEKKFEQTQWTNDLKSRLIINEDSKSRVFILDTGINEGHPLLEKIVDKKDSINPIDWGDHDHEGHGTEMAGIVAYGDLLEKLGSSHQVNVEHKLGSIKILPKNGENEKNLYGAITERAILRAEAISPPSIGNNVNSYCMAVTLRDSFYQGHPTSWSSSIDKIIYNNSIDSRNILISTGNSRIIDEEYPDYCSISEIEDPAQAWNAITVGAYTEKSSIITTNYGKTYSLYAKNGEMSPHNRTSLTFSRGWPIKPEIVFEGGNLVKGGYQHPDLQIITTNNEFSSKKDFTYFAGTSCSTAFAGNFIGALVSKYPDLRSESIRGLMIHSAEWTKEMLNQFGVTNIKNVKKKDVTNLLKHVGYGVPNLDKAIYSKENSLSMIIEETIQPYKKELSSSNATLNEIHFYQLPWPKEELEKLGNIDVKMRVTLSYFIEPSPGEKGNKNKYQYQSFQLKFDLNNKLESKTDFIKRLNIEAREDGDFISSNSGSDRWLIGPNIRNNGSIRSDIWIGNASDLASCNILAITPLGGWWKERPSQGRTNKKVKYSLIISLETEETEVELYSTIQNKIKIPISIET